MIAATKRFGILSNTLTGGGVNWPTDDVIAARLRLGKCLRLSFAGTSRNDSGFAPRWYVLRADIDEAGLTPVERQTFCPYKGLWSYHDIDDARLGHGRIVRPMHKSAAPWIWSRSNLTSPLYSSTAPDSVLSRVRQ